MLFTSERHFPVSLGDVRALRSQSPNAFLCSLLLRFLHLYTKNNVIIHLLIIIKNKLNNQRVTKIQYTLLHFQLQIPNRNVKSKELWSSAHLAGC